MKVGFTCRQTIMEGRGNMTEVEGEYMQYYPRFGIYLVLLTPEMLDIEGNPDFLEKQIKELGIEGFIIGGGNGVDPKLWGEEKEYENRWSDPRQRLNEWVLDYATKNKMPVLGVCTGLHAMNVFYEGKLVQNIPGQTESTIIHSPGNGNPHTPHEITLSGKAVEYFGSDVVQVNSYHSQGIVGDMVGKGLQPWASCADDTVEAVYHTELPMAGITWHPERDYASPDKVFNEKLVKAFVNRELFWKK